MTPTDLSNSRLLARNAVINLLGSVAPLLVAIVTIPMLVTGLGTDRLGFLTVAWVLIGYFSLFDLGLGRALTKLVSEKLGSGDVAEVGALSWTALFLMAGLGLFGSVALALVAPWLSSAALKIPTELQGEARISLFLMAASLPFVIVTAGLRGLLEANQRFGLINALRVPMGVFNYVGPLLVLPFSTSLVPITAALVVGRILAFGGHLWICLSSIPHLGGVRMERKYLRSLVSFGSWITLSNIVSPLMSYMDRFLVGALVSMTAVAYYVTPYEVVMKLGLLPAALLGVLFPAFSATIGVARDRTRLLLDRATRAIFLGIFPLALTIVTLAPEILDLWLGSEFAVSSTPVLRWLAAGILINSIAQIPYAVIQSAGRPDLVAKFHLAELPFYALMIVFLGTRWGIEGVAIAWTVRAAGDAVLLFWVADRLMGGNGAGLFARIAQVSVGMVALAAGSALSGVVAKSAFLLVALPLFFWVAWARLLDNAEKGAIRGGFRRVGAGGPVRIAPVE